MTKIDNGGPVFPMPFDDRPGAYETDTGMTLRDYFAAKALAGMLDFDAGVYAVSGDVAKVAAQSAYAFADAMIAARKEPTP